MRTFRYIQIHSITFAFALLMALTSESRAQIEFSSGSPYTQNFDTLANSGSGNAWADNSTLPGWYASKSLNGTTITTYTAGTGSTTAGALYSFGVAGVNAVEERALGSLGSGTPGNFAYGVRFVNNTANAITNITISYTGEQWRCGNNTSAQPLTFSYRTSPNPITDSDAVTASVWTTFPALTFSSVVNTTTAGALDGNDAANRTAKTGTLTGVTLAPNEEIFFRWFDLNDAGNDHGIGLDDLTITWTTTAPNTNPPSISAQPTNLTAYVGTQAKLSVTAAGAAPLSYSWFKNPSATPLVNGATGTGSSISGADTAGMIISALSTNDAGTYHCVVANNLNTATSSNAVLTVLPPVVTNIAYLRTLIDANYSALDTNTPYTVEGVVVSPINMVSGGTVFSFFIEDPISKKGIDVFHRGGFIMPAQGELVRVTASMLSFNGLLELNPTTANAAHKVESLGTGNPLPSPNVINMASASSAAYMDALEGSYVIVSNVYPATNGTTWSGTITTLALTNSQGQTLNMFVGNYATNILVGQPIPAFCASVRGIISQNDNSSPFDSSYQLLITAGADLEAGTPPTNNPATPIPLNIAVSGANVVLTWADNVFSLQTASTVTGQFNTIVGSQSPYTTNTVAGQQYYRLIAP